MARRGIFVGKTINIFHRNITVDHTQAGSTNSSNFTVLVSLSDTTLKTIANGGNVSNSNGYDILFYSDNVFTSLLNWEMEFYDPVNGVMIAWVYLPTVSHTVDTVFYMDYGDPSIVTFQGGAVGSAWNSDYGLVSHLPNGTTLTAADSTSNANVPTIGSQVTAGTGKIDGGAAFPGIVGSGASVSYAFSASITPTAQITASLWVKGTPTGTPFQCLINKGDGATQGNSSYEMLYRNSDGNLRFEVSTSFWETVQSSAIDIMDGNWHYVVGTYDGSFIWLYIDGTMVDFMSFSGSFNADTNPLCIGALVDTNFPVSGTMDEVRISSIGRSADWVLTQYNNQNNPGNIGSPGFLTIGSEY